MQKTDCTTEEEMYINRITKTRSVTSRKLKEICNTISKDSTLQEVIHLTLNGWSWKEDRLNERVKLLLMGKVCFTKIV